MDSLRQKPLILLIDDETIVRKVLGALLKKAGYDVMSAGRGDEGVLMARGEQPDLIILDIIMPGMSGFEVMQLLKSARETANIPVIFLSGKIYPADKLHARDLGAADFIEKPFDRSEILARVQTHLGDASRAHCGEAARGNDRDAFMALSSMPADLLDALVGNVTRCRHHKSVIESQWRLVADCAGPNPGEDGGLRAAGEALEDALESLGRRLARLEELIGQLADKREPAQESDDEAAGAGLN